ncbi:four helix bundle protein [Niabella aurantiaca]|uniref:four helix bundle protein n=1 Tax=Niabella aurantiaca TaxID=379900 RepID=UPI0003673C9D|nr:four helix bundle protein [Niabella aurantiaca]
MKETRKYDLEDRLVYFAILALNVCDILRSTKTGNNLEHQLSKSGTAPASMYGEVQAAKSPADFIHKMKCALKELRETRINLRIISEKHESVTIALQECNELITIFAASVSAAGKNRDR